MADESLPGQRGKPWRRVEIEAAVAAYVSMLRDEMGGVPYVKSEVVRNLQPYLPERSGPSIDRKMQNISAVLDQEGWDWIDGYKPLDHYQAELRNVVVEHLAPTKHVAESMAAYEDSALPAASARKLATDDVIVPTPARRATRNRTSVALTGSAMSAMRDFKKRQLGSAGEAWVIDLEREQLARHGRPDLAENVRWVAVEDGDGAGYDIKSFRTDGTERLIEVKTTNLGVRTPFYITRWEVGVSRQNPSLYSLYRVHGFARDPRIYVLDGSVEEQARLIPKVFLGTPL